MKQCLRCQNRLFFMPLPSETFHCCSAYGETVKDIDLEKGVSPAVENHGLRGVPCEEFEIGKSICEPSEEAPFSLQPIRDEGERYLKEVLGIKNVVAK